MSSCLAIKEWHSRGYLPHRELQRFQTITFRLYDSLPRHVIDEMKNTMYNGKDNPQTMQQKIELIKTIEKYEDAGYGECLLKNDSVAEIVQNSLLFYDDKRYKLLRWCIMPNHVHVLIEVLEGYSLSSIVNGWRSFSAHAINKLLERKGHIWMKEYFDRFIRDAQHFDDVVSYIDNNPVKAGLVTSPEQWKWSAAAFYS